MFGSFTLNFYFGLFHAGSATFPGFCRVLILFSPRRIVSSWIQRFSLFHLIILGFGSRSVILAPCWFATTTKSVYKLRPLYCLHSLFLDSILISFYYSSVTELLCCKPQPETIPSGGPRDREGRQEEVLDCCPILTQSSWTLSPFFSFDTIATQIG
jgi:hypothetical protein